MSERRKYSAEEKAAAMAALDACNGNASEAAKACGIPESTIRSFAARAAKRGESHENAALHVEKKRNLADSIENLAWRLIRAAKMKGKIENASLSQIMVSLGISIEKIKLLRSMAPPPASVANDVSGRNILSLDGISDDVVERILKIIEDKQAEMKAVPEHRTSVEPSGRQLAAISGPIIQIAESTDCPLRAPGSR